MPTMTCASCGKLIPLRPVECPHCKAHQAPELDVPASSRHGMLAAAAAALVAGIVLGYFAAPSGKTPVPEPRLAPVPWHGVVPDPVEPPPSSWRDTRSVNYQVTFRPEAAELSPDGENIVQRVLETLRRHPMDTVVLAGYASRAESKPEDLALARANAVKVELLAGGVSPGRIRVAGKIADREFCKTEIYIVAGFQ